jgi:hypothetical protein
VKSTFIIALLAIILPFLSNAPIGAAYGVMNQLAGEAKGFSSTAKGYQKQFETISLSR